MIIGVNEHPILAQLSELLGRDLNYGVDIFDQVYVSFSGVYVKDEIYDHFVTGATGRGDTPKQARQNYVDELTTKIIAVRYTDEDKNYCWREPGFLEEIR